MISLYDILHAANGQLFGEPASHLFTDFCLDPRDAGPSLLYVAIRSPKQDTHQYIEQAIQNGVSGVLCIEPPTCDASGVSILMVDEPVEALLLWAKATLTKLQIKTLAVAGSSGTSIAIESIGLVLSQKYSVHYDQVSVSGRLGVALSLAKIQPEHDFAVIKFDTQQMGDMAILVECLNPVAAIIPSSACVITDAFQSCADWYAELSILTAAIPDQGLIALNQDDPENRHLNLAPNAHLKIVSIHEFGADWMAYNIITSSNGTGFDVRHENERYKGRWFPILGEFNLYSVLLALVTGEFYKIADADALKSLTNLKPLPGHMNPFIGKNGCLLVDDSFSANPAGTLAILDWLEKIKNEDQRTIFVLGDMDANSRHYDMVAYRNLGKKIAEGVDILIAQGIQASEIARSALAHGMDANNVTITFGLYDSVQAVERLNLDSNDILLVKGGRQTRLELFVSHFLSQESDKQQLVSQARVESNENLVRPLSPSWIELDYNALSANLRYIQSRLLDNQKLMAVIKADAYGHGAVPVARVALLNGADYLAVANISEALTLRQNGITAPILVMGYIPIDAVSMAIRENITVALYSLEIAEMYNRAANEYGDILKGHIKIDTGMGRLGIFADDAVKAFRHMLTLKSLVIEGIYTHFSSPDSNRDYTNQQVDTFKRVLRPILASGLKIPYIHASNSAGMLIVDDPIFNLVRVGLSLYGLNPSSIAPIKSGLLTPILSWKTVIAQIKEFPPQAMIGYSNTYQTSEREKIAILPVGYADGMRRSPAWKEVLIHGKRAPIVGRISMEKCAVKVDHIDNISLGDEVVLIGKQGDDQITADEVAGWLGTISYEIITSVMPRQPRH
ncbi:alanine racemase [Anaerolineales bacterium]